MSRLTTCKMLEQDELSSGQVIGGAYKVIRSLGAGSAGTVYEVEDVRSGSKLALKAFTPRKGDLSLLKKKFIAEARILAKLDAPNIVKVYDSGIDDTTNLPYFVMDEIVYKDGLPHTLDDVDTTELSENFVKMWFEDLAAALDYIHAMGIVHRDIKGGNVLLRSDKHVMLSDFGLSKVINEELSEELQIPRTVVSFVKKGSAMAEAVKGSAGYMAPEVANGELATRNSDVYSLGVVFFRLLTGLWHEPGTYIVDMLGERKYRWDKVLPWMLETNPKARPYKLSGLSRLLPQPEESGQQKEEKIAGLKWA